MTAILEDIKDIKVNQWGSLNTATSPGKLKDEHSPRSQNVWTDEKPGSVITANGYIKLGDIPSGNPPTLLINFFKTSDGSSQLIVSDNEKVWATTDYVNYTVVKTGLSQYFQLRGAVIRDKLWLTNGSDAVMTWDGSTLTTLDGTGGTPNVPRGKYIAFHDERVWIYGINGDLSSLRFSALANTSGTFIDPDNASAWPTDNEIQISEGDADQGTGIFLYRGFLFCSKQYSIWRITGYDEYTFTRVKTRSSTGTRFQESIQVKDNLVHFIGVDGFYVFDGEDSKRISDIVDPVSSEEGVFAFRNLQQPLLNTRFWNVTDQGDFNAGTVPNNIQTSNNALELIPADDSQADFNSGTKSNVTADDNPGYLQLSLVSSGAAGTLLSAGKSASMPSASGSSILGSDSYLTDSSNASVAGYKFNGAANVQLAWQIDLGSTSPVGRIVAKNFYYEAMDGLVGNAMTMQVQYSSDNTNWSNIGSASTLTYDTSHAVGTNGLYVTNPGTGIGWVSYGPSDVTINISTTSARYWRIYVSGNFSNRSATVLTELEVYRAGYESSGTFYSSSIDFGSAPASYGKLAASITDNGQTYQFFTQSSPDGSTWDAAVNVSNGASIGSSLQRYLRWGVTLSSATGVSTPVIDKVYVGATYVSEIHDTGGTILQWGAFQASQNAAGQTITYYFRAASSSAGVSAASWTAIVPGAVPNTAVTNTFIQFRIHLSTDSATSAPSVSSYTQNWVLTSSSGASVLQNVASVVILNRYWLAAATLGATENDIIVVLGKMTFQSPWQTKDFKFLSFCRFQDIYIAGSSEDGSLYRLEYGYSKNGTAMDSYYETKDFSADGFFMKGRELLVTCDRLGNYNLSVGWSLDGGLNWVEKTVDLTRTSGDSLSFTKRLNINFMSDSVRFRVRTNAADQPFSVDEIQAFYKLSPQRGTITT